MKLPSPPTDARLTGAIAFADVLQEGAALPFAPVDIGPDDLLFLQYTGGTTGLSKAQRFPTAISSPTSSNSRRSCPTICARGRKWS
jgi:acyl-CoA synthetase (AMP-forming)/AMP-acid ligase II